jgi:hypothetical protein
VYSYEDRIQPVRLYIKLGKRTGATIRQLGYLTKNALRAGMGNSNEGAICLLPLCAHGKSILTNRNRRRLSITSIMIAA